MTIAFPAYHTVRIEPEFAPGVMQRAAQKAVMALGWPLKSSSGTQLQVRSSLRFTWFCEVISIDFAPDGSVVVTSRSGMPTRCLDWGKNRRNAETLVHMMREIVQHEQAEDQQQSMAQQ